MKAKITVFLIALAIVLTGGVSDARAAKQEQSWLSKIFSNDEPQMIQKSPFSPPQKRTQNSRLRPPKNDVKTDNSDDRTQAINQNRNQNKNSRTRYKPKNDLSKNYAERVQTLRQQRMNAMKAQRAPVNSGVND